MTMIPFTNFTKGEIAPELQARIDTNQYASAAKKVRNFIIQRYGGLAFRPGFRLVGEVDDVSRNVRYIPFQFNIEQSYIMALDHYGMRLLAAGGFVVEDNLQITSITQATNAQLTVPFHEYVGGERIYLHGISGMVELNGRYARVVSIIDASTFTIDIDTRSFGTFTGSNGTLRSAPPLPPPPPPGSTEPAPAPTPPPEPAALPPPPTTTTGGGTGGDAGSLFFTDAFFDDGTAK